MRVVGSLLLLCFIRSNTSRFQRGTGGHRDPGMGWGAVNKHDSFVH